MPRNQKRAPISPDDELRLLERALALYLEGCYRRRQRAEVGELAATLGLSRQFVNRRIATLSGETALNLMRQKQLEYARTVLLTTQLPVEQVAVASAFGSPETFNRLFKAAFGMTPARYRQQMRDQTHRAPD